MPSLNVPASFSSLANTKEDLKAISGTTSDKKPGKNRVKVNFIQEKVIVQRWEMAHFMCIEKLFHIEQLKNFPFFFYF